MALASPHDKKLEITLEPTQPVQESPARSTTFSVTAQEFGRNRNHYVVVYMTVDKADLATTGWAPAAGREYDVK